MEEPATTASVLLAADALPTGLVADTPADGRAASYASRLDAACRAWNMNGDGNGEIASDPLLTRLDEQAFFDVWGDGEGWDAAPLPRPIGACGRPLMPTHGRRPPSSMPWRLI
ncbi:hypothetical protein TW95_gp0150 [Pandoravirus inopinatum]|uniref:Uncharacterized protein n=1 Tax=Pandoravirus inopinatum TaxID=1605721 RepID=A0A0B5J0B4_9VIRU|nr:hypothetical protein TW95_gp0150 [Pandoravirus inopinatum]AJF96884.1 hypothetical protein [Pandoravirus inopinatum]